MRTLGHPSLLTLMLALGLGACGDSETGEVSLRLASHPAMMMGASAQSAGEGAPGQLTISIGPDEIVLDQVQVVLRKIRLDGTPAASCPADSEGDSRCAEIRLGPVLFDLPLGENAQATLIARVPVGRYDRLKFQIHKPSDANADADLVAAHPEMADISIRATGTYNGSLFTFASDLTEVEDLALSPAVEVSEDGELPLTLHVDVSGWFVNEGETGLVDPSAANDGQSYEAEVEQNIRESFRAFH
jgi:hypothetical protein